MEISITGVMEVGNRRTLAFAIKDVWHSTGTYRYSVEKLPGKEGCFVSCSFALVPNHWYGKLHNCIYRKKTLKETAAWLERDLLDIEHAACTQPGRARRRQMTVQPS